MSRIHGSERVADIAHGLFRTTADPGQIATLAAESSEKRRCFRRRDRPVEPVSLAAADEQVAVFPTVHVVWRAIRFVQVPVSVPALSFWLTYWTLNPSQNELSLPDPPQLFKYSKILSESMTVSDSYLGERRPDPVRYPSATASSSASIVMDAAGKVWSMSVHRSPRRTVVTDEQLPMIRSRPSRATVRRPVCARSSPSSETATSVRGTRGSGPARGG